MGYLNFKKLVNSWWEDFFKPENQKTSLLRENLPETIPRKKLGGFQFGFRSSFYSDSLAFFIQGYRQRLWRIFFQET